MKTKSALLFVMVLCFSSRVEAGDAAVLATWSNFLEHGVTEVLAATPNHVLTSAEIGQLTALRDQSVADIASARAWILLASSFPDMSPTSELYLGYAGNLLMNAETKIMEMWGIVIAIEMLVP